MARLWHSGFELGSGTDMFDAISGTVPTFDSGTVASASSIYSLKYASGGTTRYAEVAFSGTSITEFYYRMHFRIDGFGTTFVTPMLPRFMSPSGEQCSIRLNSTGFLVASRNGTALATAGTALSTNTWYLIECHVVLHASTGTFDIKVDGSTSGRGLTASGNTKGQSEAYISAMRLQNADDSKNCWYDDVAINDVSGSFNTGWIGDGTVVIIKPSGAGDTTTLTRGGSDSGSNAGQVDEIPTNDATDYVFSSTATDRDLYAMANTPSGFNTVNAIMLWMRTRLDAAGAGTIAATVKSGGTVNESSTHQAPSSSAYTWKREIYDKDPTDSAAWTTSKLDALQAGVTVES